MRWRCWSQGRRRCEAKKDEVGVAKTDRWWQIGFQNIFEKRKR